MPLMKGKSKEVVGKNISEFHKGKTFAKTLKKFGKAKANAQAIAVAMNAAGKKTKKFNKYYFEKVKKRVFNI
jgi:aminoglycoside phosphotransferase family enzyme